MSNSPTNKVFRPMNWQAMSPDTWRFRDSRNACARCGDRGIVIIDRGPGAWLNHLNALP